MQKFVDYFNAPAISQSDLKNIWYSLALFNQEKEKDYKEKKGLLFGSAIDTYTTLGAAEFNANFGYVDVSKPGEKPLQICHELLDIADPSLTIDLVWTANNLITLMDKYSFRGNWTEAKRLEAITSEGYPYFEALFNQRGKIILDPEQAAAVTKISHSLLHSSVTGPYFNKNNLFQQDIRFIHRGIDCKALLDIVIVDEENKTVRGVDLKTMEGSVLQFHKSVKRFRYDIQGAWYCLALHRNYPGYNVLPFRFLVESTTQPGTPVIYQMSSLDFRVGTSGAMYNPVSSWYTADMDVSGSTNKIPGYEDCMSKYIDHKETGQFETELEISDLYDTDKEFLELNAWTR